MEYLKDEGNLGKEAGVKVEQQETLRSRRWAGARGVGGAMGQLLAVTVPAGVLTG